MVKAALRKSANLALNVPRFLLAGYVAFNCDVCGRQYSDNNPPHYTAVNDALRDNSRYTGICERCWSEGKRPSA